MNSLEQVLYSGLLIQSLLHSAVLDGVFFCTVVLVGLIVTLLLLLEFSRA